MDEGIEIPQSIQEYLEKGPFKVTPLLGKSLTKRFTILMDLMK